MQTLDQLPATYDTPAEAMPLAVWETERSAQQELLCLLRLVDAGRAGASDRTRRPTAAEIKAISELLVGGDYYLDEPPEDGYHDDNAGPIRAFAWPMVIQRVGAGPAGAREPGNHPEGRASGRSGQARPRCLGHEAVR